MALFNSNKNCIHMLGNSSWRLDGWNGREGMSYVCVAFRLDGKDGMGSVYDCLLYQMVFCSRVYGFMGCVVREVEMEIVIGVRGCGSVDSK